MRRIGFIALLVLVIAATFGRSLTHQFVQWDDFETIANNPHLRPPSFAGLAYYWTHRADAVYIPLTYTFWSAIAVLAQTHADGAIALRPSLFHAANIFLHMISSIIVFDLLRRLLHQDIAALIGALLFAIHPLQVESVAWAVGARDLLCGMLSLWAMWHYVRFAGENAGRSHYFAAIMLLILAMLAKSTAVVVPVLCAVIDLGIFHRPMRRVLMAIVPMLLLTIPILVIARFAQGSYGELYTPLWTRPFIAADSLTFYLWKLFWPTNLAPIYGRTPTVVIDSGVAFQTWIIPALIAIVLFVNRKRWSVLIVAAIMFLVALSPTLGFTQFMMQVHSTVADHYMYLPMFAAALAAAWIVSRKPSVPFFVACATLLGLLAFRSFNQTAYWHDSIALFSQTAAVDPDDPLPQGHLGQALILAGRSEEAIPHLRLLVQMQPQSAVAQYTLGQAMVNARHCTEALGPAYEALRLANDPNAVWEHYLIGEALACAGRLSEAEKNLEFAAQRAPNESVIAAELQSVRQRLASTPGKQ
jgi:hypothetical protein